MHVLVSRHDKFFFIWTPELVGLGWGYNSHGPLHKRGHVIARASHTCAIYGLQCSSSSGLRALITTQYLVN